MSVTLRQHESINLTTGKVTRDHRAEIISPRLPRYPLYAHRDSLRRNNLVALHSALVIVALNDGTAHRGPITTV